MSTEQCTKISCNHHDDGAIRPVFATRDFYLACFLKNVGYELLDLGADGRRRVFRFRDTARRCSDVMAFYADLASVRPLAFSSTIKHMKALLYNA